MGDENVDATISAAFDIQLQHEQQIGYALGGDAIVDARATAA